VLSSASSNVIGFQSEAVYVWPGQLPFEASIKAAIDETFTTRLTDGAKRAMEDKMPVVPIMAGSKSSFCTSLQLRTLGLAV
jgi:hypothetical protein